MKIRTILADDHQILREGLRRILETEFPIVVIGEADNGRDVVEMVRTLNPDLIMMDIAMPDLNGIEATRKIKSTQPSVKIIALSMHADAKHVGEMLSAGASGYLLKDSTIDELRRAIETVMANRTYLSPAISEVLVRDYLHCRNVTSASPSGLLTEKEREVLQLIAEGIATKDIASRLFVSVNTVETHRKHLMEKLGIHSVAELTKYAIREGLTSLE